WFFYASRRTRASGLFPYTTLFRSIEHLAQQRVEAVEEQLRQAPVGERRGQGHLFGAPSRGVQPHEQRCGQGREDTHGGQDHERQGQQAVREVLTTVLPFRRSEERRVGKEGGARSERDERKGKG